ncbi:MAG: hypothetical protein HC854_10385 [Flavobacterium sp.]|nr:hypothetical protein [Flavobacterium sp.]
MRFYYLELFKNWQQIVFKHSNASEVNIYLNQYDNDINVMVEDNGKGFDVNKINENDGIGLKNMERKVEQLLGTFTIDTKRGRGTTIIIELPL